MSSETVSGVVILSTSPSQEEAETLARKLVEERRVACVNILPGVRSIYRWEGEIQDEKELLLVMKTVARRQQEVLQRIQELHSYSCPEAIVLPLVGGSAAYLEWLEAMTL